MTLPAVPQKPLLCSPLAVTFVCWAVTIMCCRCTIITVPLVCWPITMLYCCCTLITVPFASWTRTVLYCTVAVLLSLCPFQVRSFGGEGRQMGLFTAAVENCERLGAKMSFAKSASEGLTRGSVYVSLLGIYALCGARVRSVRPGLL